jgi:hypothetical protein
LQTQEDGRFYFSSSRERPKEEDVDMRIDEAGHYHASFKVDQVIGVS